VATGDSRRLQIVRNFSPRWSVQAAAERERFSQRSRSTSRNIYAGWGRARKGLMWASRQCRRPP
jgi:hypothetical protein